MRAYIFRNKHDDSILVIWADNWIDAIIELGPDDMNYESDRIGLVQKQFTTSK
jgi:hypothetical protein